MPGPAKTMKPKAWGGKITSVKIGPKWTFLTIRVNTKRLAVPTCRAVWPGAKPWKKQQ